jgi:hypothetical protein
LQEQEIFLLSEVSRQALELNQSTVQWLQGKVTAEVKQMGLRLTAHFTPSAEV